MKTTPPLVSATIPINKEDLFWVLFRLYQLMNDASPFGDSLDDADEEADPVVVLAETSPEGDEEAQDSDGTSPPDHFQTLYAAQENFNVGMINEYIGLFAILSTPLDNNPTLKKEFIEYARQQGHHIEYNKSEVPPKKPKLSIVPSPTKDDPDDGKKPPKK